MKILMIEDDELLSESVKMLLEKHGFQKRYLDFL